MRVDEAVLRILADEGVDRVFGNPGTTELSFVDALVADGTLPYVLAVHEGPLVAMADGYARGTGRPAFVNLHVAAGTANGLIGLLNASRSRTPLVVLAGQQDSRHLIDDPMLSADLVALAQGATTWAVEARRPEEVPALLRRAFRAAQQPPRGPVLVSVPMDFLETGTVEQVPRRSDLGSVATTGDVAAAAELLRSASSPAVVAGDGIGRGDAVAEATRVAHLLGAVVYHAPMNDRLDFPMDDPAYHGMLAPENAAIRSMLERHDVVLLAGVRAFVPHHYSPTPAVGPSTRLIQFDEEPAQIGYTYPVEVGVQGDLRRTLAALAEELATAVPHAVAPWSRPAVPDDERMPLEPRVAASTVARHLPPDALVVEEAITAGLLLREHLLLREPGSFHHTVGGGLGWGAGAAIGLSLARPGRPVVALLGDGCALFGLQALWTAAREQVPVTFLVFANGEYRTLKQTLTRMRGGRAEPFLGMDLGQPAVDWPQLAASLGVEGVRVRSVSHLAELLHAAGSRPGPQLVEIPIRPFADA
ncbi:MAG: thiamine pyrophosphate-binding protein [Nocardioides sp.]|uniref:thiamine pyrophosphate-binding protein n=1 Tax=Nocardioides sp. TaxID=35761 RepID=UPI0039E22BBB